MINLAKERALGCLLKELANATIKYDSFNFADTPVIHYNGLHPSPSHYDLWSDWITAAEFHIPSIGYFLLLCWSENKNVDYWMVKIHNHSD